MDDKEVDNNNNNSLVSEPEGDHDETPSEDVVMVVRRTKDDHEEDRFPGSPFQDDMATKLQNQSSLLQGILHQSKPDCKSLLPNITVSNT